MIDFIVSNLPRKVGHQVLRDFILWERIYSFSKSGHIFVGFYFLGLLFKLK